MEASVGSGIVKEPFFVSFRDSRFVCVIFNFLRISEPLCTVSGFDVVGLVDMQRESEIVLYGDRFF